MWNRPKKPAKQPVEARNAMPQPYGHGLGFGAEGGFRLEGGSSQRKALASPLYGIRNRGVKQAQVKREAGLGGGAIEPDKIRDRKVSIADGGHEPKNLVFTADYRAAEAFARSAGERR